MANLQSPKVKDMTSEQQAWLAGMLEGEGSFFVRRKGKAIAPIISMTSTDLDVLETIKDMTGVGHINAVGVRNGNKPCWAWTVGAKLDAIMLMGVMFPRMHTRRQGQIEAVAKALDAQRNLQFV